MSSHSPKILSRAMLLPLLAATALLLGLSSRLVRSSIAQQSAAKPETTMNGGLSRAEIADRYGKLPLSFEANEGQTDPQVKFLSRGPGYSLFLTSGGFVVALREPKPAGMDKFNAPASVGDPSSNITQQVSVLRLTMIGANPKARAEGQEQQPGKINYLIGNDQTKWRTNIPTFRKVHYKEIYPKVDLIYYGNQTELEYDFIVAPGGNVQAIKFQIDGADRISLDRSGALILDVKKREVKLSKPVIYQLTDKGDRREVKGDYVLKGKEIGFRVKSFDPTKPLIIDPVLSYSTLLGAGSNEYAYGIAVDSSGNAYITGHAQDSGGFPTTPGAFQTTGSVYGNAFVSKLDATGTNLVYSTYLSGSNGASATAIAVDSSGNAYVTGRTSSTDFPVVNALKTRNSFFKTTDGATNWTNNNNGLSVEITALAVAPSSPNTIYAASFGGPYKSIDGGLNWQKTPTTGLSGAYAVTLAVDPTDPSVVYLGPITGGLFKTTNAGNTWSAVTLPGSGGASCVVFDPVTPTTIYLGSSGVIKSTDGGTTWTQLSNFGVPSTPSVRALAIDPTTPATIYAGTSGGGVFKTTNGGTSWTAINTGLSGTYAHYVNAIVLDPINASTIYAGSGYSGTGGTINKSTDGGTTWSPVNTGVPNFAISALVADRTIPSTIYAATTGDGVIKTTNGGASWSPASSGLWKPNIVALVADPSNSSILYAGGYGSSSEDDAFVSQLNSSGSGLLFSTYLGGSGSESGYGIALDNSGNVFVTGYTSSVNFPVVNAFKSNRNSDESCIDGFVSKINLTGPSFIFSTYLGGSACDTAYAIAADPAGNAYVTGYTASTNFPTANPFQATLGTTFTSDAFATKLNNNGTVAYSTYLGGNGSDIGYGIAADSSGNAYLTGQTTSSNFPTLNPIQPTNGGFAGDAFVTKLNNLGSALVYSTYLGGSNIDSGRGIAVDSAGNAYVTGFTSSAEFPLVAGGLRTKSPLFKSTDGAANWSNDNYGLGSISNIVIHPTQTSTLYAGATGGVAKSINGGRTWSLLNSGLNNQSAMRVVIDPVTPSTIYAATSEVSGFSANGVYKSVDSGNTWSQIKNGMTNTSILSLAIDPVTPTTLYAGTYGGPVYKTVNGGINWAPSGSPSLSFAVSLAIDPSNPSTIFAADIMSNGGIFRSTNAGATWQQIGFSQTGAYGRFVVLSPLTPTTIYAASSNGLFKSVDGGDTWISQTPYGLPVFDPVDSSILYLLTTTGVLKSTDGGQNWTPMNKGLRMNSPISMAIDPTRHTTLYLAMPNGANDNDAFVSKINPSGSALIYSTLLGGSLADFFASNNNDEANAIAVDSAGSAYVAGQSRSLDFPVSADSYQPFNRGFTDVFISKLIMSYIISGHVLDGSNVPVSGAEVTLSNGASLTSFITASDGSYEFSRLSEGGNFTVSAAKPNFTMAPTSLTFNNLNSNQTLNFIATATNAPFYTISGQVTDNGSGLSDVTVTLSGTQPGVRTTDINGNYSFTVAGGSDYTVTPAKLGFSFSPSSLTFNGLSSNQTADFTSTRQNFVVTNANDHGTGSLRQAILDANSTVGLDMIVFNIPGSGVHTINLLIALPEITDPVVIDATTQPGYAGTPLVELNGAQAGGQKNGFFITAGSSTIRGFVINRFSDGAGITLRINGNNVIQGNYIGIDATGTLRRHNNYGIVISGSSNNTIGGTTSAARNVVSANGFGGISAHGSGNRISGNFIGTNAAGTAALGNGISGVEIFNVAGPPSADNVIGGLTPGAANLISGNGRGISANSPGTLIQGNLIGTDISGTSAVGNGTGIQARAGVLIGGTEPGARNIISGNASGVYIEGQQSKLQGNFIGTDVTGTLALGNTGGGVFAGDRALIGGTTPEARNIISGNGGIGNVNLGYNIHGDNVTVQGNYIGTDVTGSVALVNPSVGISISQSGNLIGGLEPGARNIIAGNSIGIQLGALTTANVTANVIQGNFIGLNAAGNAPLPNQGDGVMFAGFSSNNTLGGSEANAGNIIAFNGGNGAFVSGGTGNSIRGNSIFSNLGLGIDLFPGGVTANDSGDADTGGNNLQNFPLLTSVTSNGPPTGIQGSLHSTPNTIFRIDFYSNAACDSSGNGEGARFFDTTTVSTDGSGNAVINFTSSSALASGRVITATATDPLGNTSEFSQCTSSEANGSVQFSSLSYSVLEDVGNATITVLRSGGSKGTLSVNYSSADITATAGSDYTGVSGTLVFADGETTMTFSVPIADDGLTEPPETLRLSLSAIDLETLGTRATATLTIQDSSTPLVLTANNLNVLEGDSGTTNAVVTVNLSAATGRTVTADFNTTGGSATSGVDFTGVTGSLTFAPGVTVQTITIPIIGDTASEGNEFFSVVLSNPANATIGNSAFVTILNDPPNAVDDTLSNVPEDSSVRTIPIASLLTNDTNGPGSESVQTLAFSLVAFSAIGGTASNDATNVFFTPAGNFNGFASFRYRLSDNGAANPENDTATVRFNITEVADTPLVSNATTFINQQTTSGLVISRNSADSSLVTHFKITNIVNGTLFKSNGTTPINPNDFITSFEGSGGVKFTPAADLTSPGSTFSFDVQGSTSNSDAGLGSGIATAMITVNPGQTFIVNTLGDAPDLTLNGACDTDAAAGDQCTLRAAIQETNNLPSPDTITFDPALNGNSIILNSALDSINGNLAIEGPGASLLTVKRSDVAGTRFRIFTIGSGRTVSISALTLANGRTIDGTSSNPSENGGGILNSGTLNLEDVVVSDNRTGNGFSNFSAGGSGGGIYSPGSLTLTNSSVVGNQTGIGGSGSSGGYGGGIYSLGPLKLTNSSVNGNQTGAGGGIGESAGAGGGIFSVGTSTLINTIVSSNQTGVGISADGAGIRNLGPMTVIGCTISNNIGAGGLGGGIANADGPMTLTNSIINGNQTRGSGGGVLSFSPIKIVNSSITNNSSGQGGGLVINSSNISTVANSTISGNRSSGSGGGIFVGGSTVLTSLTITNNSSDSDGNGAERGGGIDARSVPTLTNSIVAGNFRGSSPETTADDISGTAHSSSSFNLIGAGGSGGLSNGANNNQVGVSDARLGPLANNGGPTLTHALLSGSPAIDAGDNAAITNPPFTGPPFTDQRVSFSRIVDGDSNGTAIVDIGAYERQQGILIDTVNPPAGRTSGGQQIQLAGAFANLSTVTMGGASASWFYTNGNLDTGSITVTTPAHAVGAVQIELTPTSGSVYSRANAFAYLPTTFTDNTILVGQTTAKAQHIIELRQAVDALRAVAGLTPAPWTDPSLTPLSTFIKAVHILELRSNLDDAATRLGYATSPYTDPSLGTGFMIKRIHIEELRQRIRAIAG